MDVSRYKRRVAKVGRQVATIDFKAATGLKASSVQTKPMVVIKPKTRLNPKRLVNDFVPAARPSKRSINQVIPENPEPVIEQVQVTAMPIDMELPGEASNLKVAKSKVRTKQKSIIRSRIIKGVIILLIFLLAGGGFLFSRGYIKIHKAFKGSASSAVGLKANPLPSLLKGEGDGRINILLLGRGGGNHDAPDLTDTLILASIDPVNHTASMISIPRDLWVKVEGQGSMKINAVWETGEFRYIGKVAPGSTDPAAIQAGFDNIDKVVTTIFGVPINYNAIVDFQAFKQAVDTVGGITVNVPEDLYDPTMAWENNWNPLLAKAGVQTFNGNQALIYVRSRETSSDFARSLRQRTVMLALKTKIDTLGTLSNPIKIAGLINAFGDNVATDLSLGDASRLYSIVKKIPDTAITSIGLSDPPNHFITTGPMNGQSIDLPTAGLFNYSDIQTYLKSQLIDGYILKENAKILVLNGTNTSELATTVAAKLETYGYNVVGTSVAPHVGWIQTTLVDLTKGKNKYTKNYLEERYKVTAVTTLPDVSIQTNGADFVIILGSDEINTPKT